MENKKKRVQVEGGKDVESRPKRIHRTFSRALDSVDTDYKLGRMLGEGAFAKVRYATHKKTGKEYAIKMIAHERFAKHKQSIEDEITVLSRLSHPGIVSMTEVVRTPAFLCIVMELCTGGELFDRIVERERYTEEDARTITRDIIRSVKYLHGKNVVHRDLKPENLIFSCPGDEADLKITDFGLASFFSEDRLLNGVCGTPEYVAPEVIARQPYTHVVDCWSIGVILYILLCGFPPFYGNNDQELFGRVKKGEYDFPSPWFDKVSEDAKDLIRGLLTVDPTKRLTIDAALEHVWLTAAASDTSEPLAVQGELARYNASRRFRKCVLCILAFHRMAHSADMASQARKEAQAEEAAESDV